MKLTDRTLTSKQARAALWIKSGGLCSYCGSKLSHTFHVDHVIPWRLTKRTNPHEMVAACAPCNLRKGDRVL